MTRARAPSRSRVLVVLGMHRSGTSALARCLNLLGAGIGERLIPANWGNERGFWEDEEVVAADTEAFARLGMTWHDVRPMPDDRWWERAELADVRRRVADVVRGESARHPLWVVKDPRLSRLLPLWHAVLADAGVEPLHVVSLRHPAEIAASQRRRDEFPATKSNLLWLRHVLEAEIHTRGARRVFVRFDDLLRDASGTLVRVGADLDVRWPVPVAAAAPRIAEFLSGELKHFSLASRRGAGEDAESDLAAWVRDVHEALDGMASSEPAPGASEALDRVHGEMRSVDRLYGPVIGDLVGQLAETRAAVDSEHAGWVAALDTVERQAGEIAARDARLAAAERRNAAVEERLATALEASEVVRARARELALRGEAYEARRVARLIDRMRPRGDLSAAVSSAFRQLLDDSRFFGGDLRGYALAPGESLRCSTPVTYPIEIDRPGLAEVWLAVALDVPPETGKVTLEVLSARGELLRRAECWASRASEGEPLRFGFTPITATPGRATLRVSAEGLDVPLRLFEWQRRSLGGLGGCHRRAFCALQFADGLAPRRS